MRIGGHVLGALIVLAPSRALAADLYVGPTRELRTLGEAFAAAASGDRLLLDPAAHEAGSLVLNNGVALEIVGGVGVTLVPDLTEPVDFSIFQVRSGGSLTLTSLDVDGEGRARLADVDNASLSLLDSTFANGQAGDGGAVRAVLSSLVLSGGELRDNVAGNLGGHVYAVASEVVIEATSLQGGSALGGSVIHQTGGAITLLDATIEGSIATGSVIQLSDVDLVTLEGGRIANHLSNTGSIIDLDGPNTAPTSSITGVSVEDNDAAGQVIRQFMGTLTVDGSTFLGNDSGSLAYLQGSFSEWSGNLMCGNRSWGHLIKFYDSPGSVHNNVFLQESVVDGVAAYAVNAVVEITNNDFVGGVADTGGTSFLSTGGGHITSINNLVVGNASPYEAAVWLESGSLLASYSLWYDNAPAHVSGVMLDGTHLVDVEPGFVWQELEPCSTRGLVPGASSPLLDAGDPMLTDADGSRSDIGAFGGAEPFTAVDWRDADVDGFTEDVDCDDADDAVYPGAVELACDGVDQDCDPDTTGGEDIDQDGVASCEGDCDDDDATRFPGAREQCDGVDQDCDDLVDEEPVDGASYVPDRDGDGVGAGGAVRACTPEDGWVDDALGVDCDDNAPSVFPGAIEVRDDAVDQDCDGLDLQTSLEGAAGFACGCSSRPGASAWVPWLALGLALRRRRIVGITAATLLPGVASATDWYVGPAQDFPTISSALQVVQSGDRILIDPGTYAEFPIRLTGITLDLIGAPGVVLHQEVGSADLPLIAATNSVLRLEDIEIQCDEALAAVSATDSELNVERVTVEGCTASENGLGGGLYAVDSTVSWIDGTFRDNTASVGGHVYSDGSDLTFEGVSFEGATASSGTLAEVQFGGSLTFDDCEITGLQGSATLINAAGAVVTLRDSVFLDVGTDTGAMVVMVGGDLLVDGTTIDGAVAGLSLFQSTFGNSVVVQDTRILHASGSGDMLALLQVDLVEIKRNFFCDLTWEQGLIGAFDAPFVFRNNVVTRMDTAIGLRVVEESSSVYNNHFVSGVAGSAAALDLVGNVNATNNFVGWNTSEASAAVIAVGAGPTFTYGLVFENSPRHSLPDELIEDDSSNLVGVDPGFAEPASESCLVRDVLPPTGSPLIDAGDPDLSDVDGTRSDIGAFGGPDPNTLIEPPDADADGYTEDVDCDDNDPSVNPGKAEIQCDDVDNDCLPETLDSLDRDADGSSSCKDCDDADPGRFPGNTERCDGLDQDCDADIDEDAVDGVERFLDGDGDGSGGVAVVTCADSGSVTVGGDCDDTNARIHPGATDVRDDGIDQDCDGVDLATTLEGAAGCACDAADSSPAAGALALMAVLARRARPPRSRPVG